MARQRHQRCSARCCWALRVSADNRRPEGSAQWLKTRAFPRTDAKPGERRTVCWRGLDSKFQFRATFGGLAGLRVTRSGQSSGSYRSPFRLAAGGSGFELRLRGFGPRLSSLVCRLESLGIPLKARILRESNGIEDGGTGSQSSPWINVRSRVSAQLVVAPGPWSPATRHHLAPPTNSPDRFRAGRSPAPSGSSRTRSHDTASAARSRS